MNIKQVNLNIHAKNNRGWSQEILLGRVKALQGGQIYKNFFKSYIFSYILPIFLIPRGGHDPP